MESEFSAHTSEEDYDSEQLCLYDNIAIKIQASGISIDSAIQENVAAYGQVGLRIPETEDSELEIDGYVTFSPSETPTILYSADRVALEITGPQEAFGTGRALSYMAGHLAGCLGAIKNQRLLIHAASVYSPGEDESILLIGEKGAGKTTLSTRMCLDYGYRLVGNDQVYIGISSDGKLLTTIGSTWIDIRETAEKAEPYLAQLGIPNTPGESPAWNNKRRLQPSEAGIETHDKESPISNIYNIRIDRHENRLRSSLWTGVQRSLILHERIGRQITGQTTPFQDDKGEYLGSIPPIELDKTLTVRDTIVKAIIQKGITQLFGPSSEDLAQYITNKH